jgi:hypothetical protein
MTSAEAFPPVTAGTSSDPADRCPWSFALDSVVSCAIISTIDGRLRHAGHTAATGPAPSHW